MNLEFDPRTNTAILRMKNGAVVKIRESAEGELEIRETTHRHLNIKPTARNSMHLELEDPISHPRLIEFDLPVRQTADLEEIALYAATWEVPMQPRNLPSAETILVEVEAVSAQDAISKALSAKPGHTWGKPTLKDNQ